MPNTKLQEFIEKYAKQEDTPVEEKASKKETRKELPLFVIEVDDRERGSDYEEIEEWFHIIAGELGIKIEIVRKRLFEGDYRVKNVLESGECIGVRIERKRLSDGKISLQGRFKTQLQLLIESGDVCSLVVIGDWNKEIDDYLKQLIVDRTARKGLITIAAKYNRIPNISAYRVDNNEDFVRYCFQFWMYHFTKSPKYELIREVPKYTEVFIMQLMGIPDIGYETAKALAEACPKGYEDLIKMSIEDIMKITAPKSTTPSQIKKNRITAEKIWYGIRNMPYIKSIPQETKKAKK
jgi:ERCC4-type nuclease